MQRPTFLAYSQYDEGKAFCIWPVRKDTLQYESFATVGEIRVYRRADFQSGSRVLKKVF